MRSNRVITGILIALVLGAWCGWESGFPQSSTGAFATWSASLAGVLAIDLLLARGRHHGRLGWPVLPAEGTGPQPTRNQSRSAFRGVMPWLVLGLVALTWELLGINTAPQQPHLTISALAQLYRPINALLLLVWILAGVGYGVARANTPAPRPVTEMRPKVSPFSALSAIALAAVGHVAPMPAVLLPHNRAYGVAFWILLVVVGVLMDQVARRSRSHLANAGELMRLISRPRSARIGLVAAWAFAGWHLFAH